MNCSRSGTALPRARPTGSPPSLIPFQGRGPGGLIAAAQTIINAILEALAPPGIAHIDLQPVHHRVAEHFCKGRAFLVGDAAHIHSPRGRAIMSRSGAAQYDLQVLDRPITDIFEFEGIGALAGIGTEPAVSLPEASCAEPSPPRLARSR